MSFRPQRIEVEKSLQCYFERSREVLTSLKWIRPLRCGRGDGKIDSQQNIVEAIKLAAF